MKKIFIWVLSGLIAFTGVAAFIWFANPFDLRDRMLVSQIVQMRVAPKRLEIPKTPRDYAMLYSDVDIITEDNIRLSAWEIPSPTPSDKTVIVNHPLTTTRYGSDAGLDGVAAEFLPMVKHLHDANYNIVMYDHRGQGESDGGLGSKAIGSEALVGAGITEWQDVAASLRYVLAHPQFGDDDIFFLSQCMGANATFLAWKKEPDLFSNPQIKGLIANQPTLSFPW
ncbi:MAG: alpha/beta hydrolase [Paracoccaceae bacterium]